jgi:hypothetical protein
MPPPDTAEQKRILRDSILLQLHAVRPGKLSVLSVRHGLTVRAFHLSDAEVEAELEYLEQRGFVKAQADRVSAALTRWGLTAEGVEYLETERLA